MRPQITSGDSAISRFFYSDAGGRVWHRAPCSPVADGRLTQAHYGSKRTHATYRGDGGIDGGNMGAVIHDRDFAPITNVLQHRGTINLMDTIADRLRSAREAQGLTQPELAKLAGVTQGTIGNVESGFRKQPRKLLTIARVLGVSPQWLATGEGPRHPAPVVANVLPASVGERRVPLISYVQAGMWTEVSDPYQPGDASDWLQTDLKLSDSAFALEIEGDSMLPEFRPGDRIIIDPALSPRPGDYVVAKNGEEEATFKKYRPRGINANGDMVFELVPLNDDYPTLNSDMVPIRIIGVMVEHRKYRQRY